MVKLLVVCWCFFFIIDLCYCCVFMKCTLRIYTMKTTSYFKLCTVISMRDCDIIVNFRGEFRGEGVGCVLVVFSHYCCVLMGLFLYTGSDSSSSTSSFEDDGVAEQLVRREVTPPQPQKKAPKDKGRGKKSGQPLSHGKKIIGNMYIYKYMTYNVHCL